MKMTEQQKIAAKLGMFDPVAELLKDESEKIASVIESLPASLDHIRPGNKSAAFNPADEVEQGWADEAGQALQEWVAQGKDPRHFSEAYAKEHTKTLPNMLLGGLGGAAAGGLLGAAVRPNLGTNRAWAGGGALIGGLLGARGLPRQQHRQNEEIAQHALAERLGQGQQGQGMERAKEGAAKVAQPPMGAPGPAAGGGAPQMSQAPMPQMGAQPGSPEMQAQQAMMDAEAMKADPLEAQNETLRKVIQNQKLKLELAELTDKVTQAAQPPQMPQMGPEEGPEAGGDGQAMSDPMEYMRQALSE